MLIVFLFFMTVGLFLALDVLKPPFGVVFDVATGEYIDTAIITLVNAKTGQFVTKAISDLHGRYYFFAPPGQYRIIVERTHFEVVYSHSPIACIYGVPYQGQIINHSDESAISYSIAMKQTAPDWNHKNKLSAKRDTAGVSVVARWIVLFVALLVTVAAFFYFFFSSLLLLGGVGIMMLVWWGVFLFDHSPAHGIRHWGAPNYRSGYVEVLGKGDVLVKKVPITVEGNYWALIPPGKYTVRIYGVGSDQALELTNEYKGVSLQSGVLDRALVEHRGVV